MKFAIIETGGKQYKVSPGQTIKIEKIARPPKGTPAVAFDRVLLTSDDGEVKIGLPFIAGAKVSATFLKEGRGKKINVLKYKSKVRYKKLRGHRQYFTEVKID